MRRPVGFCLLALAGYVAVAVAFSWPLPLRLTTALTGAPSGDTGVYIWNLWTFQRELIQQRSFPLTTTSIFAFDGPVDLSQHNYTLFSNLLALPLTPLVGLVAAFNIIYLLQHVLAAFAAFLLARRVTGSAPAAWLGGLLFGFSPALVARGTAHFSLVAAAPLALFAWLLLRAEERGTRGSAVALGLTVAWAGLCDPYYAIYCVLIGAFHMAVRLIGTEARLPAARARQAAWLLDGCAVSVGAIIVWIGATGGGEFALVGSRVTVRGLHNPVLLLTVIVLARVWLTRRRGFRLAPSPEGRRLLRAIPWAVAACAALLSPVLIALALRASDGRFAEPQILWRSSPPGVDLAAWLLPNPSHPLWRDAPWVPWLTAKPGGFAENVASIPVVALLAFVAAAVAARWRASLYWMGFTAVFGLLSLGPFIRVAGLDTYVPTPWALLRYVPAIEWARSPARFTAVALVGVSVLFALAVAALARRWPGWRRGLVVAAGAALIFELLPAPRPLYSAVPSPVYGTIAADARPLRVLEVPFGIRDGTSSAGNSSAGAQFNQTFHRKPLIGGYLSRVSRGRVERARRQPVLSVLIALAEGREVSADQFARARSAAPRFLRRFQIGYVVVDRTRTTPEAIEMVVELFDLMRIDRGPQRTLYIPRPPPTTAPPRRR